MSGKMIARMCGSSARNEFAGCCAKELADSGCCEAKDIADDGYSAEMVRIPHRGEISAQFKWKLEDMFADDAAWKDEYNKLSIEYKDIARFQGTLSKNAAQLCVCLKTKDAIYSRLDMLFTFARMRRDEDNANDQYQALTDMALSLYSDIMAASAFIEPELLAVDRKRINTFLAEEPALLVYRHYIDELFRQKEHILSEREEMMLAMAYDSLNASSEIYSIFSNTDLKFPNVHNEAGEEVELTEGRYVKMLESRDRQVREETFSTLYATYEGYKNTLASTFSASIKKDGFLSSIRNYPSSIEMYLDDDMVPVSIYDKLIETVDAHLPLMYRYLKLRKKLLQLDELHMYDLYTPIISGTEKKINYNAAVALVQSGLSVLGEQYGSDLEYALSAGWIDVYENANKTRGAYSWGAYASHPYVLLNYQNTVDDVLTLAHEIGHALHSYYTNRAQPYVYSEYKIFVAEVASTVNESIMLDFMIKGAKSEKEKAYLLNRKLETIRGTLFRQTMFAEFERIVHRKVQAGEPLTPESLSSIYKALNDKYFAKEVTVDAQIALEWARIPHFYSSFYVYKYATGISAATALTNQILHEGEPAIQRYMKFLTSGCSNYPLQLLNDAGVDLTTSKPVEETMHVFREALDELESITAVL